MGRGRAKAKQTKVARDLKYSSSSLDPEALKRELASQGPGGVSTRPASPYDEDDELEGEDED